MGSDNNKSKLKRELGLWGLFSIASGAMISSGLFVLPGIAFADVGPSLVFSYLIASLLVIPAMLSKAELSTAMPKAGGTYFFIDRSIGPLMGTIGGFAAWFSLAFKSAFALVGIGVFAMLINPGFTEFQTKLIAVFFCILFTIINVRGVKHTGRTQILIVLGLLCLITFYVVVGVFFVDTSNYVGMMDLNLGSIFSTAGLIFVSYGGLTKICSVAEECKEPGRNIPRGMIIAWGVISIIYILVILVTIGLVEPGNLSGSKWAISLGASTFLGDAGMAIMAVAAILAFISTANAGILAASRDPMAMSKDRLLPRSFSFISNRGTPTFSILFTSIFMIIVILFLDLKDLVKTASLLKILLFLFVIFSLITMRQSKIRNYRPKFKSPFYPWVQIFGIFGLCFLIIEMGIIPMIIVLFFIFFGFLWYWFFARDKIWREYTLLHIVEKITGQKSTSYMVDEELREILIDRDDITENRFKKLLENCEVYDLEKYLLPDEFARLMAKKLSKKINIDENKLYKQIKKRELDTNIMVHPGIAIFTRTVKGKDRFDIILVRSKKGLIISDKTDPIYAFVVLIYSRDQKNFHLHSLMWLVQIADNIDFRNQWIKAKDANELRKIFLESWKNREEI